MQNDAYLPCIPEALFQLLGPCLWRPPSRSWTSLFELQLIIEPREASLIEADRPLRYIPDCKKGVTMTNASVAGSAEVEVYANWALIMVRMTYASVGADPWTVVQNKIHPAVAEPEFTPLDLSYMSR